jgi:uncharacterized protein YbjQ (UPF0145 family)
MINAGTMERVKNIPLYTTDEPPVAGQRVVAGWLEWCQRSSVNEVLHVLAANAIASGADAIVGLRLLYEPPLTGISKQYYTAYGTAVVFG